EVFRFIWDNRDKLHLREGAYTEVLSVRPCVRVGTDGFVLRETVAEYYQVARLTSSELKAHGVKAPREYLARLRELKRERLSRQTGKREFASDDDTEQPSAPLDEDDIFLTPLYGGGILIFDEYGRVKHWVHNDVFGKPQDERLAYLWSEGF